MKQHSPQAQGKPVSGSVNGTEDQERTTEEEEKVGGGGDVLPDGGEVEVSVLLEDAILKRPGSLRVNSGSGGGDGQTEPDSVVFTFPSISNLGNVEPGAVRTDEDVVKSDDP